MIRFFGLTLTFLLVCTQVAANESFTVYVPDAKERRLLAISIKATTDGFSIEQDHSSKLPFSPSAIAVHPNGKRLIVSGSSKEGTSATTVDILNGENLQVKEPTTLKHPAGYTSVDQTGRFFMTSHYQSGTIAVYRISQDGLIASDGFSLKTPNAEAHCILTTPDNRFAYVPCVKNNNALFQYAFDEKAGTLASLEPFNAEPPAMFGPRHVAYHPTLPIVYFSNEQQLGISVYTIGADGQLSDLQHATTIPRRSPFEQGKRDLHASDLVLSPDGKRLFVAVRDFNGTEDSVFSFRVGNDGKLSLASRTIVGDIPWKLDISPNGTHLVVSESGDSRLSFFEIESDGALTRIKGIDLTSAARDIAVLGFN